MFRGVYCKHAFRRLKCPSTLQNRWLSARLENSLARYTSGDTSGGCMIAGYADRLHSRWSLRPKDAHSRNWTLCLRRVCRPGSLRATTWMLMRRTWTSKTERLQRSSGLCHEKVQFLNPIRRWSFDPDLVGATFEISGVELEVAEIAVRYYSHYHVWFFPL